MSKLSPKAEAEMLKRVKENCDRVLVISFGAKPFILTSKGEEIPFPDNVLMQFYRLTEKREIIRTPEYLKRYSHLDNEGILEYQTNEFNKWRTRFHESLLDKFTTDVDVLILEGISESRLGKWYPQPDYRTSLEIFHLDDFCDQLSKIAKSKGIIVKRGRSRQNESKCLVCSHVNKGVHHGIATWDCEYCRQSFRARYLTMVNLIRSGCTGKLSGIGDLIIKKANLLDKAILTRNFNG